jgi:hypothetical protein
MKRLLLVIVATTFVTGCVYSERRSPYGYSRGYSTYSTVTPVYPRYEEHYYRVAPQPRYVVPAKPFFRAYEDHHEHEHRHHRHEHNDDDDHSYSRSRSPQRW